MDQRDPSPIAWASRLRLLDIENSIAFGQQLGGDFRRKHGPGLTLSPGRWCLKVRLLFPFNVLRRKLALRGPNYKDYSGTGELFFVSLMQYSAARSGLLILRNRKEKPNAN